MSEIKTGSPLNRYLLEAVLSYAHDNQLRVHTYVFNEEQVYPELVPYQDDNLVTGLNVSAEAIRDLHFTPEAVEFKARFNGQSLPLSLRYEHILAVRFFIGTPPLEHYTIQFIPQFREPIAPPPAPPSQPERPKLEVIRGGKN